MIWRMVVVCTVLESTDVAFFHTCIMAMIAVDRFLEIYLNIKYNIYWSVRKTKITLIVALAICFLSFIPLLMIALKDIDLWVKVVAGYIFPMILPIFLVIASLSYFSIVKQVLRHRKNAKRLQKQLRENNKTFHNKQSSNKFKLLVSTLITITCLLFMICPNFIKLLVVFEL